MASGTKKLLVHKELEAQLSPDQFEVLATRLQSKHVSNWKWRSRPSILPTQEKQIAYAKTLPGYQEDAITVFLVFHDNMLRLTNIVTDPGYKRELSISEYNIVFNEFSETILCPELRTMSLQWNISEDLIDLSKYISGEAEQRLSSFSHLANKNTGSSHPSDMERWYDFIIRIDSEGSALPTVILHRWLVEIEGWAEDTAFDLIIQYDFGIGLLKRKQSTS